MSRNKDLAKNTIYLTLGKISTQFISFLLLPLYTGLLSTTEYGTVDLINTYQQLLVYVVFLQIEQGVFRFLIDKRGQQKESKAIVSAGIVVAIVASLIFTAIFIIVYGFVDFPNLIFLLTNVLAVSFSGLLLQIARGFGDNISYVIGSFVSAASSILFNVIFIAGFHWGASGMLLGYFLGNVLCVIVIFFRCNVYKFISFKAATKKLVCSMLKYSIPMVPNSLAWWVISASDRTVVLFFMGASYNGLLAVSHKFSTVFASVFQIFNLSWSESASLHINDEDRSEFFSSIINKAFCFFSCLCIGIIACMPFAFSMLVNPQYAEAYEQIPLFLIGALMNAAQGLYSVVYIALKQTKKLAYSTVAAAIINVLVGVLTIKFIGLYAAPVSTIVSYVVIVIYRYIDLRKYVPLKLDYKKLAIITLLLAVTLVVYYIGGWVLKVLVLAVDALAAFLLNKTIIMGLPKMMLEKFKR